MIPVVLTIVGLIILFIVWAANWDYEDTEKIAEEMKQDQKEAGDGDV